MAKLICIAKFGPMECAAFGDPEAPQVFSVTPQIAVSNQSTEFTVTGMNLPDTTAYSLSDCGDQEDLGGTAEQRKFSCTPESAGPKDGVVEDQPDGNELFYFTVNVQ